MSAFAPLDENRETNVPCSCAPPTQKGRLPHSRWGIASFVLPFLIVIVCFAYCIICARLHSLSECQNCLDDWCFHGLEIALSVIPVFYFAFVVPFIFAIIGLCQPRKRKIFAILGFCLSAPPVACLIYYRDSMIAVLFRL